MTTPVYAVTGASGHVGRYAVHQLLARGVLLGALRYRPRRVRRGSLQQPLREGGQVVTSAPAGAASYHRLQGIITDRDIVVKCLAEGRDPKTTTAGDLAQGEPVWVDADADDSEVLRLMEEHQIRRLPVIEEHRLVGMISEANLATHLPEAKIAEFARPGRTTRPAPARGEGGEPGPIGSSTVPPPKRVQALRNEIMFVGVGRGRTGWPAEERA